MKTAAEYRAMAEECFKWARQAQADELRVSYLQFAPVWLDAASKLDNTILANATTMRNMGFVLFPAGNKTRWIFLSLHQHDRTDPPATAAWPRLRLFQE